MSDSTQAIPLTCAGCGKAMQRATKSLPQGRAMCQPCRSGRPPRPPTYSLTCASCGKGMNRNTRSSLPQGQATCLACRRARAERKRAAERSHPTKRVCPMCRRSFETRRRTYCSPFCKTIGSRIGGYRHFLRMEGEYRPARWWIREGYDPRWIIGPPRTLLDVWVTPTGEPRCTGCASPMRDLGPMGHECTGCGSLRVILTDHG